MATTLINRMGYILNAAESAIVYLNDMLGREDISPVQRFFMSHLRDTLMEGYSQAERDMVTLSFLEDELNYQRQQGYLQDM